MFYGGHVGPAIGIITLVVSTAFLVWVGEKTANPFQKFGKVIAWIAVVISCLIVLAQSYTCAYRCYKGDYCWREGKGMHMMGPGMKMGPMMPPPQEKGEEERD